MQRLSYALCLAAVALATAQPSPAQSSPAQSSPDKSLSVKPSPGGSTSGKSSSGKSLPNGQLSAATTKAIGAIFESYAGNDEPGCAVGIYRNGTLVYAKGFGSADLEHDVPIAPNTAFDIGSTSKQFTAACILLLQQDGKLSLDDDIHKHLPEIPDYGHPITIRNLLNHTSGLRDYLGLMTMAGFDIDDVTTMEDAFRIVARQKGLDFTPGTRFAYSNTGYMLAAEIVRRVSGRSIREFAHDRIFAPLGMTSTGYVDDHTAIVPNRAIGYSRGDGALSRDVSNWEQNGDGGVFTTVEDLLKWDENFYAPKVGGAGLVAELQRRGVLTAGDTLDYAAGLFVGDVGGIPTVLHGGAWGGYRSELIRVPSEHLSVAVLANGNYINPTRLATRVVEALLADRLPKKKETAATAEAAPTQVKIDPALFDRYAGDYELEEMPGFVITFSREGEHYYAQATGQERTEIVPASDTSFFPTAFKAMFRFHREADGSVSRLTLVQGGEHPGRRVEQGAPTVDLSAYAGRYYSPELENTYTLAVEDGKLMARHARLKATTLIPSKLGDGTAFSGDNWYLGDVKFEKGGDGAVTAMLVSLGRSNDIRFERLK